MQTTNSTSGTVAPRRLRRPGSLFEPTEGAAAPVLAEIPNVDGITSTFDPTTPSIPLTSNSAVTSPPIQTPPANLTTIAAAAAPESTPAPPASASTIPTPDEFAAATAAAAQPVVHQTTETLETSSDAVAGDETERPQFRIARPEDDEDEDDDESLMSTILFQLGGTFITAVLLYFAYQSISGPSVQPIPDASAYQQSGPADYRIANRPLPPANSNPYATSAGDHSNMVPPQQQPMAVAPDSPQANEPYPGTGYVEADLPDTGESPMFFADPPPADADAPVTLNGNIQDISE